MTARPCPLRSRRSQIDAMHACFFLFTWVAFRPERSVYKSLLNWIMSLRTGLYLGALASLAIGLFLWRLWQPEEQVRKHSAHLLEAIAHKDWTKFGAFIDADYHDQWGNDRATVLARTREVFRYLRGVRINAIGPNVRLESDRGVWQAYVVIDGNDDNELMGVVKARVNAIKTPFELEWRRISGKPWDWKLVSVRNQELVVPSDY